MRNNVYTKLCLIYLPYSTRLDRPDLNTCDATRSAESSYLTPRANWHYALQPCGIIQRLTGTRLSRRLSSIGAFAEDYRICLARTDSKVAKVGRSAEKFCINSKSFATCTGN